MASLLLTRGGLDICDLANRYNKDLVATGRMYAEMSDRLGIVWMNRGVESLEVDGRWQALASAATCAMTFTGFGATFAVDPPERAAVARSPEVRLPGLAEPRIRRRSVRKFDSAFFRKCS